MLSPFPPPFLFRSFLFDGIQMAKQLAHYQADEDTQRQQFSPLVPSLRHAKFFFVRGFEKSGTSWLRGILSSSLLPLCSSPALLSSPPCILFFWVLLEVQLSYNVIRFVKWPFSTINLYLSSAINQPFHA